MYVCIYRVFPNYKIQNAQIFSKGPVWRALRNNYCKQQLTEWELHFFYKMPIVLNQFVVGLKCCIARI